jgi:hypothetical protein
MAQYKAFVGELIDRARERHEWLICGGPALERDSVDALLGELLVDEAEAEIQRLVGLQRIIDKRSGATKSKREQARLLKAAAASREAADAKQKHQRAQAKARKAKQRERQRTTHGVALVRAWNANERAKQRTSKKAKNKELLEREKLEFAALQLPP